MLCHENYRIHNYTPPVTDVNMYNTVYVPMCSTSNMFRDIILFIDAAFPLLHYVCVSMAKGG
jgi:TRAP-type C4-dicarboxylate transport system permease large subunit